MKICVTSSGNGLDDLVDPRFGRCARFLIIDPENMEFEPVPNENAELGGGAGIQSGQLVSSRGVQAVLTGNVGPNAFRTLQAAGIAVFTGVSGTVREAVQAYVDGRLEETQSPSVGSKHGMG
jgi:predicted Fe-Mo cluster-binding NifX family protein